jgi:hypothetical protein
VQDYKVGFGRWQESVGTGCNVPEWTSHKISGNFVLIWLEIAFCDAETNKSQTLPDLRCSYFPEDPAQLIFCKSKFTIRNVQLCRYSTYKDVKLKSKLEHTVT